jgi:hypothetical protein
MQVEHVDALAPRTGFQVQRDFAFDADRQCFGNLAHDLRGCTATQPQQVHASQQRERDAACLPQRCGQPTETRGDAEHAPEGDGHDKEGRRPHRGASDCVTTQPVIPRAARDPCMRAKDSSLRAG